MISTARSAVRVSRWLYALERTSSPSEAPTRARAYTAPRRAGQRPHRVLPPPAGRAPGPRRPRGGGIGGNNGVGRAQLSLSTLQSATRDPLALPPLRRRRRVAAARVAHRVAAATLRPNHA